MRICEAHRDGGKAISMNGDPANLERCLSCKHSRERNPDKGTLVCQRYSMLIDNEADEIPDDCVEYEEEGEGSAVGATKDGGGSQEGR